MYKELPLKNIKACGWVKNFLINQAENLSGDMDTIASPFSVKCWETEKFTTDDLPEDCFLGGLIVLDDAWVPFEQNGYWIDGMVRIGALTGNQKVIKKARSKIYPAIEHADKDGYIGPAFLKDGMTWAHAVYLRSLVAEYSATGNKEILEALKKHYLRAPLKDVFKKCEGHARIVYVRNIADIETALYIYGQTGDKRFLDMAEESYTVFNEIFVDDKDASADSEMKDLTIKGMLGNRKVQRNHGVTYCEICKLPAILYAYTGKEVYKQAAINAFEKLYRDQMIIDGTNSSTEYLNGNSDSNAMHETCDISDLTWALGYLYMITGDPKYGDRIENAIFNAGLGCVDDDFKGQQYFSCPNQVICNDTSNHAYFYRGEDWMSYAPKKFLACCAGNVHRFMPNFVCRSWFIDEDKKKVFASVYTPSEITFEIENNKIKIEEITNYPFTNSVKFKIEGSANFTLSLRVPEWATSSEVTVNGEIVKQEPTGRLYDITRDFCDGDIIEISFTDKIEFIENAKGVSVKKGALLYALPVESKVVIEGLRFMGNEKYPHYSLYPLSKWNYAIDLNDIKTEFISTDIGVEPWKNGRTGNEIEITAYEFPSWKIITSKNGKKRLNPRGKVVAIGHECKFMPKVPAKVNRENLLQKETIKLVPYGTTRLRIAIFPFVKNK